MIDTNLGKHCQNIDGQMSKYNMDCVPTQKFN